ncbi:response regulator transcription factor [Cetobacterium somerae]|uniref:response regulator transcription factor n=1 Tax=Cetobacterium somerae TaxID=188913 RepID=UPI001F06C99D|nr:response regulator transcription factor [Cetobacterium somerae]MCX3067758.1 response regulator transcription factor [Cetobacterium somerae]UPO98918.1 response regulator transcription factor [Cetobacterium somerae]
MRKKILIIEDEQNLANIIGKSLENEGFEIKIVTQGDLALDEFYSFSPALVLLDINLPKKNGWDICKEIRQYSKIPIIIMTARDTELDEIHGLELGADDYVTKPISTKVIILKIKKLLKMEDNSFFYLDKLSFDYNTFKIMIEDIEIILSKRETLLLEYFFRNQDIILSRETLLNEVWGFEFSGEERAVDTLVTRLRKKMGVYGEHIKSIRGVGYVFSKNKS